MFLVAAIASSNLVAAKGKSMNTKTKSVVTALASLLVVVFWYITLRPTLLGGPATYLMITGISMEPTFNNGDLVVVVERAQYAAGDIIAYSIDDYFFTERYVIHRIVGETPDGGFLTQGDNRDDIDAWTPKPEQVIGSALVRVPRAGVLVAYLQEEPWRLAAAAGGVMALSMLPLGVRAQQGDRRYRRRQRLEERRRQRMSW